MSKFNNKDYSFDPKYANWNKFYDDLFEEITKIRSAGNTLLFDFGSKNLAINQYYSLIVNLYSTHSHFLTEPEEVKQKLDKIEQFIFSDKYLTALDKNPKSVAKSQITAIKNLRNIFSVMCSDFSSNGISVKVSGKKKRDPKKAILEGYDT